MAMLHDEFTVARVCPPRRVRPHARELASPTLSSAGVLGSPGRFYILDLQTNGRYEHGRADANMASGNLEGGAVRALPSLSPPSHPLPSRRQQGCPLLALLAYVVEGVGGGLASGASHAVLSALPPRPDRWAAVLICILLAGEWTT